MNREALLTCYNCKLPPCMRCNDNRPDDCVIDTYFWTIDRYKDEKNHIISLMKFTIITSPFHKNYFIYVINTFFPNLKSTLDIFLLLS
jgi:hypothetical protein